MEEITDIVETVNQGVNYRKGLFIAGAFTVGVLVANGAAIVLARRKAVAKNINTTEAS